MKNKKDPFDFKKTVLDSGTEIFYQKNPRNETEIRLLLKGGGTRYDPIGKEGCAHMLEHLIWKRTKMFSDEIARRDYEISNLVKTNAHTDYDSIWLEGSSLKKIKPLFLELSTSLTQHEIKKDSLEREKKVVFQEMDVFQKDEIIYQFSQKTQETLFGSHPFSRIVASNGTLWSVQNLTTADLIAHRDQFFIAPNLAIVIITDLSLDEVKQKLEKYFALPENKEVDYPNPPKDFEKPKENLLKFSSSELLKSRIIEHQGDRIDFYAVVPTTQAIEGWAVIEKALEEILFRELRIKRGWIYNFELKGTRWRDICVYRLNVKTEKGKGDTVKDVFFEALLQFERRKKFFDNFKRWEIAELENYEALPSKIANNAVGEIAVFDRPLLIKEQKEEIENFSFEEAVDWIDRWLNKERILVRIVTP